MPEVIIVGGGQAALATAFYLRRQHVTCQIIDDASGPGGSWRTVWPELQLFSTASFSSLPGRQMRTSRPEVYPEDVIRYFSEYEDHYDFDIRRPVKVTGLEPGWTVTLSTGDQLEAPHVVMATGTQSTPFVPYYPGSTRATQWHTATYPGRERFTGSRVAVVGAGNSGAQIASELIDDTTLTWYTTAPPRFMPDHITGTELFQVAHRRAMAILRGDDEVPDPISVYGDIVSTEQIRRARERLQPVPMFESLDEVDADHLIWATGFRPALGPARRFVGPGLQPLEKGLHMVGYGDETGPGSATITGVGVHAKQVATQIARELEG